MGFLLGLAYSALHHWELAMIEPIRKPKAKRIIKTQAFPDSHIKASPSKKQALWGTWRSKHAKPSQVIVYTV